MVFERCAPCHREGQAAPFSLLQAGDFAQRLKQMAEVVESDFMPPWMPEPGFGTFQHARRLSVTEKGMLLQWVKEGGKEGDARDLPALPSWPKGWQLGTPDIVVGLSKPYDLAPEGADVYRNFVLPLPLKTNRYVRAMEFLSGSTRGIHHAFMDVDPLHASRAIDALDEEPGFGGLTVPADMPEGQFSSWQPGRRPSVSPPGLSWVLPGGSDLVLELHMNRTGRRELINPQVGIYFTDEAPTNSCHKIGLASLGLDIPAGEADYRVRDSYVLPVDLQVLAILPHAHYLAKTVKAFATLPDGRIEWLIYIKNWDFNWQSEYRYETPLLLPRGTRVSMEFSYDNSTNNVHNPSIPPKRVLYGLQSTDEMCELWLQTLAGTPGELALLKQDSQNRLRQIFMAGARDRMKSNPKDAASLAKLGTYLMAEGKIEESWGYFTNAMALNPSLDEPYVSMGEILRLKGEAVKALPLLEKARQLNPANSRTHGNLAFVFAELGRLAESEAAFRKCLEFNPADVVAKEGYEELKRGMKQRGL